MPSVAAHQRLAAKRDCPEPESEEQNSENKRAKGSLGQVDSRHLPGGAI